jgi:phosphoglycerol transferase MdoB-like AlkP superfamily enzyme
MNRYFSTSGCRVMDVGAWDKSDITFKTSWGACDEDLFNKTISEADKDFAAGKPFHYFCMTTSNHRPFDFPAGRIDLPSHNKRAAVKYQIGRLGN